MKLRGMVALGSLMFMALPLTAAAQGFEIGQREYMNSCAQCHGVGGQGDGVIAGYLSDSIPDLTTLQQENNGVFPVAALYGIIDGSDTSGVHGSSDMPAWGMRYSTQAPRMLGEFYGPADQETYVRGRILALIEYISTLQQE
jgi:mono/diheme cytochrome c family protein